MPSPHLFLVIFATAFSNMVLMPFVDADTLDTLIHGEMQAHSIPGLSLAIIRNHQVVSARAYGNIDSGGAAITPETLFQAGSVSKVAAATAALILVQQGKMSLDDDVNLHLKSWKVPENEFTHNEKVTVRRILSHTAGLSVHGFPGYSRDQPIPVLTDILDGTGSANSDPIRVESVPGSAWKYSGGGYIVLQQLMIDLTGKPFTSLLSDSVLKPLHMEHSTFEQPLPPSWQKSVATGHENSSAIPGQWHVYPEMAAAGLWTTPSDLARLMIAIQQAKLGQNDGVISPEIAQWMTTPGMNQDGLGLFMSGPDNAIFGHGGRNAGFDTLFRASAQDGVVIMINTNDDTDALKRISQAAWIEAKLTPVLE